MSKYPEELARLAEIADEAAYLAGCRCLQVIGCSAIISTCVACAVFGSSWVALFGAVMAVWGSSIIIREIWAIQSIDRNIQRARAICRGAARVEARADRRSA